MTQQAGTPMSHSTQRYPYRLPRSGFAWRLPLALAFSWGLMHTASTNTRGFHFERLALQLNTGQATWFWWSTSLFVFLVFLCGLARFEIPYASINDFDRKKIRGETVLFVKSSNGTACLLAQAFALPADFDACAADLVARSGLVPGLAVR